STLGCAQDADGSLLDASKITWYNDADDDHPVAGLSSGKAPSTTPLAPIFTGLALCKVAGARHSSPRRSSRTFHPSAHAADPDNAEGVTNASGKRKAQNMV
ncbi:hypothetical protein C8J57DRAFT_1018668, partial [Mycena rebaudengoi]